jgi:hypothetical protein
MLIIAQDFVIASRVEQIAFGERIDLARKRGKTLSQWRRPNGEASLLGQGEQALPHNIRHGDALRFGELPGEAFDSCVFDDDAHSTFPFAAKIVGLPV